MFTQQDKESIAAAINAKAPNLRPCSMCGNEHWVVGDGFVAFVVQESMDRVQLAGPSMPSVPLFCTNCAHTVFFNMLQLGLDELVRPPEEEASEDKPEADAEASNG